MPTRVTPPTDPVEILHDGDRIVAQRGESLAHALIAADRLPLARSPKLHRPRGPYCLRGGCDGCLARVNGVPNVMTCQKSASGGERVETQNVLGTRGVDALRAADFLFPRGIDHHRLFAGIRGVSGVVQSFARRIAGLGKLPDAAEAARAATRRELEVLVIGGGAAGLSALAELPEGAVLVDDGTSVGGATRALAPERLAELVPRATARGGRIEPRTTAILLSREPELASGALSVVALGPRGATLFVTRVVIVATGRHEPVQAFGENDLPGVYSARAALSLWRAGIGLGRRFAVVDGGPAADALAAAMGGSVGVLRVPAAEVVRAAGRSKVTGIVLRTGSGERRERVDAILVDGRGSPAFELAVQGGATLELDPLTGYELRVASDGRLADGVLGAGSVVGAGDSAASGAAAGARARELLAAR
jgi:sarcosine oxidase subunit alpha